LADDRDLEQILFGNPTLRGARGGRDNNGI